MSKEISVTVTGITGPTETYKLYQHLVIRYGGRLLLRLLTVIRLGYDGSVRRDFGLNMRVLIYHSICEGS